MKRLTKAGKRAILLHRKHNAENCVSQIRGNKYSVVGLFVTKGVLFGGKALPFLIISYYELYVVINAKKG